MLFQVMFVLEPFINFYLFMQIRLPVSSVHMPLYTYIYYVLSGNKFWGHIAWHDCAKWV